MKNTMNYEERANSYNHYDKCTVVLDHNCPLHLLEKLVYDDSWFIPYSVYYNTNCSIELKQAIASLSLFCFILHKF